jgi:hypothetical protein
VFKAVECNHFGRALQLSGNPVYDSVSEGIAAASAVLSARFSRGKTTRFDTQVERLFKTAPSRKRNADN